MDYTGTGAALQIVDDGGPDPYYAYLGGIEKLHLHGRGSSSSIALYFGCNLGSPSACTKYYGDNQFIRDVIVNDFGTGVEFGSNAFLLHFQNFGLNSQITVGVTTDPSNEENSGENINFVGGEMSGRQVAVNTWSLHFVGTSFDGVPTSDTPTIYNTGIDCVNCHVEALGGTGPFFSTNNGSALNMVNGELFYDTHSGTIPEMILSNGNYNSIAITGTTVSAGTTVTSLINATSRVVTQNISIHGLKGSGIGGASVLQTGFKLDQTGVNIEVNGNWALSSAANYNQYNIGNNTILASPSGNTMLASPGGTVVLSAGKYSAYISSSMASFGSAAVATNNGYQNNGQVVIPATATGNTGSSSGKVQLVQTATTESIGGTPLSPGSCTSATATIRQPATGHVAVAVPSDGSFLGGGYTVSAVISGTTVTVYVCAVIPGIPAAKTYNVTVF